MMRKRGVTIKLHIRKFRIAKNFTQQELADMIGIDRTTLSQYETEKRVPDILILWDIADALDVSFDDLVEVEKGNDE